MANPNPLLRPFLLLSLSHAASYLCSLRYHVALGRLPIPALLALPNPSLVPTLLPGGRISVSRRRDPGTGADVLAADGVDIVAPGIFDGGGIAVHGLDGILSPVHHQAPIPPPRSPHPPSAPPDLSLPPSDPPDPPRSPAPFDLGVLSPSMAPTIATGASPHFSAFHGADLITGARVSAGAGPAECFPRREPSGGDEGFVVRGERRGGRRRVRRC